MPTAYICTCRLTKWLKRELEAICCSAVGDIVSVSVVAYHHSVASSRKTIVEIVPTYPVWVLTLLKGCFDYDVIFVTISTVESKYPLHNSGTRTLCVWLINVGAHSRILNSKWIEREPQPMAFWSLYHPEAVCIRRIGGVLGGREWTSGVLNDCSTRGERQWGKGGRGCRRKLRENDLRWRHVLQVCVMELSGMLLINHTN